MRRRCRTGNLKATWDEGGEGVHKGLFHIPAGAVVLGGRRLDYESTHFHYVTTRKRNDAASIRNSTVVSILHHACQDHTRCSAALGT